MLADWVVQRQAETFQANCRLRILLLSGAEAPLVESRVMPQRVFLRIVLPAVIGLVAGFLALAYAIPTESSGSGVLVTLLSPGLKLAEIVMPEKRESLAWTFGWFLRIAIATNWLYYFLFFAVLAYFVDRRPSENQK